MAKPGRNDPCPCGSDNKYKKCCLMEDEAEEHAQFDMADPVDTSNAIIDLIEAGQFNEAEAAARDLLAKYPDVHDGWARLGMVHEARGECSQAADCYRKVVEFLQRNPDYAEAGFKNMYAERIANLEPPTAS